MGVHHTLRRLLPLILLLLQGRTGHAYSLLTHEALIDVNWNDVMMPALRSRYPATPDSTLNACHAYAYGGAILPDMGYSPMGVPLFSDLVHYVRTGDFVTTLLQEARTPQEYSFALGTLAHYHADRYGHPIGVNPAVPMLFPKKAKDSGARMTYEDDPTAHTRTEFGFDVLQVARGNYAAEAYQHFIAFEIADDLLKRAFYQNYGLAIDSLFRNYDRSVRGFRWAVRDVFPQLTRQAWRARRHEIRAQQPTATARRFRYRMRRRQFVSAYGGDFDRPGIRARLVAGLLQVLPKVGPLKVLKPVVPTPAAEALFLRSFDTVTAYYRVAVARMPGPLANIDWDTGSPTAAGEYGLADEAYDALLLRLHESGWSGTSPALRQHLLTYYAQREAPGPEEKKEDAVAAALLALKNATTGTY